MEDRAVIDIKLKAVATSSFTRGVVRQLEDFRRAHKDNERIVSSLKTNEAVMFLSKGGDQVRFVFAKLEAQRDELLPDTKWNAEWIYCIHTALTVRLDGAFNPLMLQNIANRVGLRLEGFKLFEEHYRHLMETR